MNHKTPSDPHENIQPRETLSDASLVVPSNRERNHTVESAPEWLETIVRTDEGRSVARNRGIQQASGDWIILADDDISVPITLSAILIESLDQEEIVGLADPEPLRWVLTRYMIFHKSIWEAVGGFDESREHGEDTDFAIRCEKGGATIFDLPVDVVPHYDTDSNFTILEHAEWLFYLLRRHPSSMAIPASKLFLRWILF